MSDKELLELAATKAGIKLAQGYGQPPEKCLFYTDTEGCCHDWSPLDDDGDALRLAVKLGMNIALIPPSYRESFCEVAASFDESGWPNVRTNEPHGSDPYAATRRAIVRAAAEIGRSMG